RYGRRRGSSLVPSRPAYFSMAAARRLGLANSASAAQKSRRAASSVSAGAARFAATSAYLSGRAAFSPEYFFRPSTSPSNAQNAAAARASVGFLSGRARKISASDDGAISDSGTSSGPSSRERLTRTASAAITVPSTGTRSPFGPRNSNFAFWPFDHLST